MEEKGEIVFRGKEPKAKRYLKNVQEGIPASTLLDPEIVGFNKDGTIELLDLFGDEKVFDQPKPTSLIKFLLSITSKKLEKNKKPIVIDFFAGSGTTGHAVLELNKICGATRQCILVTNNENDIAINVCYPRLEKVIKGHKNLKNEQVGGLGGNLKYYRTSFVPWEPTDKNKELLTKQSVEMLCLRENTFEFVSETDTFKIYKNIDHYTGIIFDQLAIPKFKKSVAKFDMLVSVYVFSLGDDDFAEDFADMKDNVKVCSIPEAILRVYRRIFK